jgi:hypothetical protein
MRFLLVLETTAQGMMSRFSRPVEVHLNSRTNSTGANQVVGSMPLMARDRHGYGKTRGFRVTGHAGTGTVPYLAYPEQTVYPCHGIAGFDGYLASDS